MADLTRALDWSQTPVGPIAQWPDALLITVNMLLASRHPMFLWWGADLVQFYNDAYLPSIGLDKHPKALGQKGMDCWPEIWPIIGPQIDAVMQRGEASWHENQLVPIYRDGKLEDVYWTYGYSPVRNPEGSISGTLVTCSDTTGTVLAERQLKQVLEATTDAVLSVDRSWRITYLNGHAKEILAPSGKILGRNFWETYPSALYQDSPFVKHYYRAMDERVGGEFEAYYPEPLNNWFHVLARPSQDGLIIFFRDVTQQRRETAALMQAEKLAAVGRLASSIAHEINNPLEAVTNLLFLLETTTDAEMRQHFLHQAQSELARVARISTQTLRFHRQSTNAASTSLQDVLESVLTLFQGRVNDARITVERQYRTTQPIMAYEADLRQVIANLVGNALDASRPGGRLVVRVRDAVDWTEQNQRSKERGVRVIVADAGHGMSGETRRQIFEPFFTTKGMTGTGLGLWVSAGILQNHRAKVRVRSSENTERHGTVFSIFFPLDAASA